MDPARTGPPARPASSHGGAPASSAGAALVEGLSDAPCGCAVLGVTVAGVRVLAAASLLVVGGLVPGPGSAALVPVAAEPGAVLPGTARSCGAAGAGAVLALLSLVPGMVRRHPGRIRSGSCR